MCDDQNVVCDAGRKMGCQTFCCRLLVRLAPDERSACNKDGVPKGFVDKAADGYCINLDRATHRCAIWAERPRTCRGYNCNGDFLLQVAVKHEFKSIVDLTRLAAHAYVPKETYVRVPGAGSEA